MEIWWLWNHLQWSVASVLAMFEISALCGVICNLGLCCLLFGTIFPLMQHKIIQFNSLSEYSFLYLTIISVPHVPLPFLFQAWYLLSSILGFQIPHLQDSSPVILVSPSPNSVSLLPPEEWDTPSQRLSHSVTALICFMVLTVSSHSNWDPAVTSSKLLRVSPILSFLTSHLSSKLAHMYAFCLQNKSFNLHHQQLSSSSTFQPNFLIFIITDIFFPSTYALTPCNMVSFTTPLKILFKGHQPSSNFWLQQILSNPCFT